jgi:hypothetical protein
VEIVIAPSHGTPASRSAEAREDDAGTQKGGSWFGGSALQSLVMRAGLNMSIKLRNVVIKYVQENTFSASVAFQELSLVTNGADEWQSLVEVGLVSVATCESSCVDGGTPTDTALCFQFLV